MASKVSETLKEEATQYFVRGNFDEALRVYKLAREKLNEEKSKDASQLPPILSLEERKLLANITSCYLKLYDWWSAIDASSQVLQDDALLIAGAFHQSIKVNPKGFPPEASDQLDLVAAFLSGNRMGIAAFPFEKCDMMLRLTASMHGQIRAMVPAYTDAMGSFSVKALYRRGIAHLSLGGFPAAEQSFMLGLFLAGSNHSAKDQIQDLQSKLNECQERCRDMKSALHECQKLKHKRNKAELEECTVSGEKMEAKSCPADFIDAEWLEREITSAFAETKANKANTVEAVREQTRSWTETRLQELAASEKAESTSGGTAGAGLTELGFYPGAGWDISPLFTTDIKEWIFTDIAPASYAYRSECDDSVVTMGEFQTEDLMLCHILAHFKWCERQGFFKLREYRKIPDRNVWEFYTDKDHRIRYCHSIDFENRESRKAGLPADWREATDLFINGWVPRDTGFRSHMTRADAQGMFPNLQRLRAGISAYHTKSVKTIYMHCPKNVERLVDVPRFASNRCWYRHEFFWENAEADTAKVKPKDYEEPEVGRSNGAK